MNNKIYSLFLSMTLLSFMIFTQGCYYDIDEELYPNNGICDTAMVTYSLNVKPMLDQNCNSCHSQQIAQGGIVLDNHQAVKDQADTGVLLGVIRHDAGFSPMPQGGSKLSNCNILSIEKWITEGALNN